MTGLQQDRAARIVQFIRDHWAAYGYGPSLDDIAYAVGYSHRPAALYAVKQLHNAGKLTYGVAANGRMISGSIRITGERCASCGRVLR